MQSRLAEQLADIPKPEFEGFTSIVPDDNALIDQYLGGEEEEDGDEGSGPDERDSDNGGAGEDDDVDDDVDDGSILELDQLERLESGGTVEVPPTSEAPSLESSQKFSKFWSQLRRRSLPEISMAKAAEEALEQEQESRLLEAAERDRSLVPATKLVELRRKERARRQSLEDERFQVLKNRWQRHFPISSVQKELAQSSASSKPKTDQHEDTLEPAEEAAQGDVKMQVQVPEAVLSVANQSDVVSPIVELERLRADGGYRGDQWNLAGFQLQMEWKTIWQQLKWDIKGFVLVDEFLDFIVDMIKTHFPTKHVARLKLEHLYRFKHKGRTWSKSSIAKLADDYWAKMTNGWPVLRWAAFVKGMRYFYKDWCEWKTQHYIAKYINQIWKRAQQDLQNKHCLYFFNIAPSEVAKLMKNFSQEVLPQWEKDLLEPKPPLIVPDSGIAARVNWLRANHKATNHKDAGSNFTSMMLLMKAMQEEDDEEDKTEDAHQEPQHHHPMHPLMHMYALAMGKLSLLLQGSAPKMKQTPDRELVKIGMQSCVAGTFAPVPPTSLQRARSQSITQSSIMAPSSALVDKAPGPRDPSTSETRPSQSTVSALARQPILEEDPDASADTESAVGAVGRRFPDQGRQVSGPARGRHSSMVLKTSAASNLPDPEAERWDIGLRRAPSKPGDRRPWGSSSTASRTYQSPPAKEPVARRRASLDLGSNQRSPLTTKESASEEQGHKPVMSAESLSTLARINERPHTLPLRLKPKSSPSPPPNRPAHVLEERVKLKAELPRRTQELGSREGNKTPTCPEPGGAGRGEQDSLEEGRSESPSEEKIDKLHPKSASGTRDSRESSLGSFENAEQGADEDDDRLDDEDAGGALVKSEVGAKAQSEELVELHYVDSQADEALDSEDPVDDGRDWDLENSDCEVDSDEDGNHDEEDDYDVARQRPTEHTRAHMNKEPSMGAAQDRQEGMQSSLSYGRSKLGAYQALNELRQPYIFDEEYQQLQQRRQDVNSKRSFDPGFVIETVPLQHGGCNVVVPQTITLQKEVPSNFRRRPNHHAMLEMSAREYHKARVDKQPSQQPFAWRNELACHSPQAVSQVQTSSPKAASSVTTTPEGKQRVSAPSHMEAFHNMSEGALYRQKHVVRYPREGLFNRPCLTQSPPQAPFPSRPRPGLQYNADGSRRAGTSPSRTLAASAAAAQTLIAPRLNTADASLPSIGVKSRHPMYPVHQQQDQHLPTGGMLCSLPAQVAPRRLSTEGGTSSASCPSLGHRRSNRRGSLGSLESALEHGRNQALAAPASRFKRRGSMGALDHALEGEGGAGAAMTSAAPSSCDWSAGEVPHDIQLEGSSVRATHTHQPPRRRMSSDQESHLFVPRAPAAASSRPMPLRGGEGMRSRGQYSSSAGGLVEPRRHSATNGGVPDARWHEGREASQTVSTGAMPSIRQCKLPDLHAVREKEASQQNSEGMSSRSMLGAYIADEHARQVVPRKAAIRRYSYEGSAEA